MSENNEDFFNVAIVVSRIMEDYDFDRNYVNNYALNLEYSKVSRSELDVLIEYCNIKNSKNRFSSYRKKDNAYELYNIFYQESVDFIKRDLLYAEAFNTVEKIKQDEIAKAAKRQEAAKKAKKTRLKNKKNKEKQQLFKILRAQGRTDKEIEEIWQRGYSED